MTCLRCLLAIALVSMSVARAVADEPAGTADDPVRAASEALQADPESTRAIRVYAMEANGAILSAIKADPADAERRLGAMRTFLDSIRPEGDEPRRVLAEAKSGIPFLARQIEVARTGLDELRDRLRATPGDAEALGMYRDKLTVQLGTMVKADPAAARAQLVKDEAFLASIRKQTSGREALAVEETILELEQIRADVEAVIARSTLIGSDAPPLDVEAWVNGEALSDSDLDGKVVLLDFWAVWCAPCIAAFPQLAAWDEQYGEKGLVIVGLTSYQQFRWDDESDRAIPDAETTPEQERAMLSKFAEQHGMTHRIALMAGDSTAEAYLVEILPQVVLIDREGKVRMIRVGGEEGDAEVIGEMLEELMGGE